MDNTTQFLLRRAREESRMAISSHQPAAADAHEKLAIRYSSKAVAALAAGDECAGWSSLRSMEGQTQRT